MTRVTTQADSGLDSDARDLHHTLIALKRIYRFSDRDRICCHDISVTQCWALRELEQLGAATLNQLAAALHLDKSTTSRVVDALERKGHVRRTRHPRDGRAVLIEATRQGVDLRERIEADLLAQERELLAEFDAEARRAIVRMIGRLADAAARQVEAIDASCGVGCVTDPNQGE